MKLRIKHTTRYRYKSGPLWVIHKAMLTPQNNLTQTVESWSIKVRGGSIQFTTKDHFGNFATLIKSKDKLVSITAEGEVDTHHVLDKALTPNDGLPPSLYLNPTSVTKAGKNINRACKKFSNGFTTPDEFFQGIGEYIRGQVVYEKNATKSDTSAEEAFTIGSGVCQDHAHILISLARQLGMPARYVSGYLLLNKKKKQEASHAWAEIYFTDLGWKAYDVSNGSNPDENYVSLAKGFDYTDVAPVKGVKIGTSLELMTTEIIVQ